MVISDGSFLGNMTSTEHIHKILDLAIEELRQKSFVPFWKSSIDVSPLDEIRTLFTDSRKNESTLIGELKNAAARKEFRSFSLVIDDNERNSYGDRTTIRIHARIAEHTEWDMVLQDAWDGAESPNDWFLSDNALRLLRWIQGPKNTGQFSSENRIGGQAGLRGMGSYSHLKIYLKEISLKSPYQVSYETTSRWGGDYKISIALKTDEPEETEFNNPTYTGRLIASDRESIQAFVRMLEDSILDASLEGDETFLLFNIRSRVSLIESLPSLRDGEDIDSNEIEEFLSKFRLSRGIEVAASLDDEASDGWRIGAVLEDGWTWNRARESIREQRNRPNPEEAYGLSPSAAKILDWVLNLHDDEFDLGMTPCVEGVSEVV
jgi:hypothetical protein